MGCSSSVQANPPPNQNRCAQPVVSNNPPPPILKPQVVPSAPPPDNNPPIVEHVPAEEPTEIDIPQETVAVDKNQREDNEQSGITPELLNEFVELEKQIKLFEANRAEEKLLLHQIEYKNIEEALRILHADYEDLKRLALKEYEDVAHFNLVSYMVQNNTTVISDNETLDEAKRKEEYEYFEAKNKQDIAEKQIDSLQKQLNQISHNIENSQQEVTQLTLLRTKVDGLLENIFNGEYGSDLEDRLELEAEQLLQYKKHLSMAHYKWWNGRQLMHHACSQMAYAVRRWMQIQSVAMDDGQAKYHMITDTRNNIIASHQNVQRSTGYLKVTLPYWNDTDDKNIVASINVIYNDVRVNESYQKALQWFRYYHWRLALLLNWMDQVINNKIVADHHRVSREFKNKYKELRTERLVCIKAKVKEVLGIDLDIEQFSNERENENEDGGEDDDLPTVESDIALSAESFVQENDIVGVEMPAAIEAESDPTVIENVVRENGIALSTSTGTGAESTGVSMGTETEPTGVSMSTGTESSGISMGTGTESTGVSMGTGTESTGVSMGTGTESTGISMCTGTDTNTGNEMGTSTEEMTIQTSEMGIGTDPEVTSTDKAPDVTLIPLSDLAPPPSDEILFGNVAQLQLIHQQQIEEFERVQDLNKERQDQGLQEKLRKRQGKRRQQKLQEEQENALSSTS